MTATDAAMAVALRFTQWNFDEAAFKAGAGRLTYQQCSRLRDELTDLADAVGRYAEAGLKLVIEDDR